MTMRGPVGREYPTAPHLRVETAPKRIAIGDDVVFVIPANDVRYIGIVGKVIASFRKTDWHKYVRVETHIYRIAVFCSKTGQTLNEFNVTNWQVRKLTQSETVIANGRGVFISVEAIAQYDAIRHER